jgi:hypothetical protein
MTDFGVETTTENLLESECTSCRVKEDKSAYWCVPWTPLPPEDD